jgi:hypothetical protein
MSSIRQHILVVANAAVADAQLHRAAESFAADPAARVRVVAPALNTRVRHWFSDSDPAIQAAAARLTECLEQRSGLGLEVDGEVGDADPLAAIDDALAA